MAATPLWFGPGERPLFGWWHAPDDDRARGVVVLCPPIGQEYMGTHRTFRVLAEALTTAGFAALRFDYDGTGDSAGAMLDPGRVAAWTASVTAAVATACDTGAPRVAVLGMRLGATLAVAAVAAGAAVDDLVLWDPSRSGRTFVREQQALASLSHQFAAESALPSGSVEAPAWVFGPETVDDLKGLDMTATTGPLATRALILTRGDRPVDDKLRGRFDGPVTTWAEATDQTALIDAIPSQNAIPHTAIASIVDWLGAAGGNPTALASPASGAPAFIADTDGRRVTERAAWLGAAGLFGIVTEPTRPAGLTAVFLDAAAEHHVGPARMWVELARHWAASGVRSLRFDLSGLGDSPKKPGQDEQLMYADGAVADVLDAVHAIAPDDPASVVLIGLCSGAYAAMDAAVELRPVGVCALNPMLSYRPHPFAAGPPPWRPVVHGLRRHIGPRTYERLNTLRFLTYELRSVVLDRLGRERLPRTVLRQIADAGTEVLLVAGAQQMTGPPVAPRAGLQPASGPRLTVVSPDDLDHSLLASGPRSRVAEVLTDHVLRLSRVDRDGR